MYTKPPAENGTSHDAHDRDGDSDAKGRVHEERTDGKAHEPAHDALG